MNWTPELIAEVGRLKRERYSRRQIAEAIGEQIGQSISERQIKAALEQHRGKPEFSKNEAPAPVSVKMKPVVQAPAFTIVPDIDSAAQTGIFTHAFPIVAPDGLFKLKLMSDLHLEAAAVDRDRIRRELDEAVRQRARIILNGDILNLILPNDRKRSTPSVAIRELQGLDDMVGGSIQFAVNFLAPYAPFIDIMGVGNHEDAVLKFHNLDITRQLIKGLAEHGGKVAYGGYAGTVVYRFVDGNGGLVNLLKGAYVHGSRGNAPVTKGIIEFARRFEYIEGVDFIHLGDNHQKTAHSIVRYSVRDDGTLDWKEVRAIRTGSYFLHERDTWGARSGFSPLPHGGAMLTVQFDGRHKSLQVSQ